MIRANRKIIQGTSIEYIKTYAENNAEFGPSRNVPKTIYRQGSAHDYIIFPVSSRGG